MPELPEVETVCRILSPDLLGCRIERVTLNRKDVIAHPRASVFAEALCPKTATAITRRGKYIQILFDDRARLIVHLRMTGCLLILPREAPQEKHTHVILDLSSGLQMRYIDPRRFGRLWFFRAGEEDRLSGIHKLGMEPLDPELCAASLGKTLLRRKKMLKECLLDQQIVAGIGNIYADEILFAARLSPKRPACSLKADELARLAAAIPACIDEYIHKNQTTREDYIQSQGRSYRSTPFLKIYGHAGDPCPLCGKPLVQAVIAQRSSVFCEACQR